MKRVEHTQPLTAADKVRVYFEKDRGRILHFVVQYYALVGGKWRTIMRVDSCHGFPHRHVYYLHAKERRVRLDQDLNEALTGAEENVRNNYQKIKENFFFSKQP